MAGEKEHIFTARDASAPDREDLNRWLFKLRSHLFAQVSPHLAHRALYLIEAIRVAGADIHYQLIASEEHQIRQISIGGRGGLEKIIEHAAIDWKNLRQI